MSTHNFQKSGQEQFFQGWDLEKPYPLKTFALTEQPKPKPRGLFLEMLQGDPSQLLQFVETKKDLDDIAGILYALQTKARSVSDLHPEELMQLDDATADMLTEPSVKRKVERPFEHVKKKLEERKEQETPEAPPPVAAFWWV